MNLYILNDVLYDYTSGMAVIAAESMEQCNQIFSFIFDKLWELVTKFIIILRNDY